MGAVSKKDGIDSSYFEVKVIARLDLVLRSEDSDD